MEEREAVIRSKVHPLLSQPPLRCLGDPLPVTLQPWCLASALESSRKFRTQLVFLPFCIRRVISYHSLSMRISRFVVEHFRHKGSVDSPYVPSDRRRQPFALVRATLTSAPPHFLVSIFDSREHYALTFCTLFCPSLCA